MKIEKKEDSVALMLLGNLTGAAWEVCEPLVDDPENLEGTDMFDKLIALLDAIFKKDKFTELPDVFAEYFFKSGRKPRETLFDYIQRIRLATRKVKAHSIELPDQVQGWLLIRRAGFTEEQKTLIMSQSAGSLGFENIARIAQSTFRQQSVMTDRRTDRPKRTYMQEEEDSEDWNDLYWYEDGENEEEDWERQEQDQDWYEETPWETDQGDPFDVDSEYYAATTSAEYDVDEYDDVYSNYVEARRRMNDLRLSRGYYPIVALAPASFQDGAKSRKGKPGKGRGKTKARGKGSNTKGRKGPGKAKPSRAPRFPGKPSRVPPSRAPGSSTDASNVVCLRCGQTGHYARDCPQPSRKRPNTGTQDVPDEAMMVTTAEAENLEDLYSLNTGDYPHEAVLDGGAQSFVVGRKTWRDTPNT